MQKNTPTAIAHCGTPIPEKEKKQKKKKKNEPNEYINNNSTKAKVKEDDGKWGKHTRATTTTTTAIMSTVRAYAIHTLVKVMNYSKNERKKPKHETKRKIERERNGQQHTKIQIN